MTFLLRIAADCERSRKNDALPAGIDSHGRISSTLVIKRFGSLRKALQESALVPARFMKATDGELCSILIDLWPQTLEEFGRSPYRTELRVFGFPVSGDTYIRRFGTWNKALLAAAESMSTSDGAGDSAEQPEQPDTPLASATKSEGRKTLPVRKRFLVFKRDRYNVASVGDPASSGKLTTRFL